MSDHPKSGPAKRRGRPPSTEADDAALKARRQRNREAQNVFRRRRQAAEAEQGKRLRRLEEVVEEMSSIFISFVDEILESEIVIQQPNLAGSLRKSMARILALANEVVGPDESEDASCVPSTIPPVVPAPSTAATTISTSTSMTKMLPVISENDTLGHSSTSPPGDSSTSRHSSEDLMDCDKQTETDPVFQTSKSAPILALTGPPGHDHHIPDGPPGNVFNETPPLPPQIYGNGWTITNHPIVGHKHWGARLPLSPDSFAYRLAKASLSIAYLILTKAHHPPLPQAEEQRIFGTNMDYTDKSELLIRLRWLLGPGSGDMYRVIDLPYGQHGSQVFTRSDLNPAFDELGWPGIYKRRPNNGDAGYLSILGVEKQLLALGGRIIDAETLELNIANPASTESPPSDVVSAQPDSWSFVDFFSPNQLRTRPNALTMQLSIGLLVSNLAQSGVCLMRGPGYPRDELGGAIQASVFKVS
ncbi:hypothetical protein EDB81DRAFT_782014 [Dactylonectria macrodidyma]|uniref:BZIP domain-containing protein n=1 Tax=Dactylonectria macrodidyma TaxID=307937 RepID=A0A9P9FNN0_9HYPO|nr:hypothetical protein EDB81DRAFT_782014 [Dactylonectria macrodidyma]